MSKLEENLLDKIKCQGLFDKIRKSCISELEVLDEFNVLMEKIDSFTNEFLDSQFWPPNQSQKDLRELLRRSLLDNIQIKNKLRMLVNKCILLKNSDEFVPQINNVVWDYFKEKNDVRPIKDFSNNKPSLPNNSIPPSYSDDEMDLVSENSEDYDKTSNLLNLPTNIVSQESSCQENQYSSKTPGSYKSNVPPYKSGRSIENNEEDSHRKSRESSRSRRYRESSESSNNATKPTNSSISNKRWYQSCEYDKYRDKKYSVKNSSSTRNVQPHEDNYRRKHHENRYSHHSSYNNGKNYESFSRSSFRERNSRDNQKKYSSHHYNRERRDESYRRSSSRQRSSSNERYNDRRRRKDLDFMDYYENSMKTLTSTTISREPELKQKNDDSAQKFSAMNDLSKANELDLRKRREEIEARLREIEEQEMAVKRANVPQAENPTQKLEKKTSNDDEIYDPENLDFG